MTTFTEDVYEESKRDLVMRMCRLGSYKDLNVARQEVITDLLSFIGDQEVTDAVEHALHMNNRSQAV